MPFIKGKKILAQEKEILAFPDHYVNIPGKIAFTTLQQLAKADKDFGGVPTLKKGTVIKMDADGLVTAANTGEGNGIVFNTIKVADFDESDQFVNVAVLVHGFVRADRLDGVENLVAPQIFLSNN